MTDTLKERSRHMGASRAPGPHSPAPTARHTKRSRSPLAIGSVHRDATPSTRGGRAHCTGTFVAERVSLAGHHAGGLAKTSVAEISSIVGCGPRAGQRIVPDWLVASYERAIVPPRQASAGCTVRADAKPQFAGSVSPPLPPDGGLSRSTRKHVAATRLTMRARSMPPIVARGAWAKD